MSLLERQAERIKLARLFDVPEVRLQNLDALDAASLRAIREAASAAIFDDARPMLLRAAAASKLLPVSALALVGEKIFGAMLCARIAGLLSPQRALEVALKLPDEFLAKVSTQIDPRSAKDVIAGIPAPRVKAVAALLIARGDYVTMGRFVDYLSHDTIRSVIEAIRDNAVLLHVSFYVENKARLNDIIDLLPEARLREIVRLSGHADAGVWPEALALMNQVSPEWRGRIGDLTADEDAAFLTQLLRMTQAAGLWEALLPVIGLMSPEHRRKLAQLPALADVAVLRSVIGAAHASRLWAQLLPLVGHMTASTRKAAAQVIEQLPREVVVGLIEATDAEKLWPDLIGILSDMDETEKRQIVRLIGEQEDAILQRLLAAVQTHNLWGKILPLVAYMGESARKTAARVVPGLSPDVLQHLIATADTLNLWPELIGVATDMQNDEQREIAGLILQQSDTILKTLLSAVRGRQLWDQLLPLLRQLQDADLRRLAPLLSDADRVAIESSTLSPELRERLKPFLRGT